MSISVIIPTYRRPALLSRCLEALCEQDFDVKFYEVIVVTDGPDAESAEVVKIQSARSNVKLRCLSTPVKRGPAAARNLGWRSASGKLILFTDDDCIPASNWIRSYSLAAEGRNLVAFTGKLIVPIGSAPTDFEKNTHALESAEFVTANCACTKAALEITNGFDERFTMAWREDSDLEFKLLKNNIPITKIESAVVVHPVRTARWGVSIKEQKKGIFNALLYKKFPQLYRMKIQSGIAWNYVWITVSFSAAIIAFVLGSTMAGLFFSTIWMAFTTELISRRLKGTSHSISHVGEMIFTSMVIPFVSLYWQIYGAVKYRVIFL